MNRKRRNPTQTLIQNPIFRASITASLRRDLRSIKDAAELQLLAGAHAGNMVLTVTRLLWIVERAALECGVSPDAPEIRIIGGAANAAGDLATRPQDLELHRPALKSGVLAAERLWEQVNPFALGNAAIAFDVALAGDGITTGMFQSFQKKERQ